MTAELAATNEIVGNITTGNVTVLFASPDALNSFIDLLNRNDIRNEYGNLLTFSLHQFRPGDPVAIMCTETSAAED